MRLFLLLYCCLYSIALFGQTEPDCQDMLKKAKAFERDNELSKAVQFYLNALNCNTALGTEIGPGLKGVFEKIEEQKRSEQKATLKAKAEKEKADSTATAAERAARRAYADDLAYKSTIALRDGDRNTAFRLAEFAHRYVEADNPKAVQALINALYYYDNPDPARPPLPRVANLEGHTDAVTSVAFSPDGKRLATGSNDNTAKIWDLDSAKALMTLEGHTDAVNSVAFSPDGKRLATGVFRQHDQNLGPGFRKGFDDT
jgi:hypothetical protein